MYTSKLDLIETEKAIKYVKDLFEEKLSKKLNLTRVSAPLFVYASSGLNDDLNGTERAVHFEFENQKIEIVQSLAKWKRHALSSYNFDMHTGLYTDMNAIRQDETLDDIHSMYVDQWDWEYIINKDERNLKTLKKTVKKIYSCLLNVEKLVNKKYPVFSNKLSKDITFISTDKLLKEFPNLSSKERETAACKKYGSIFLYKIGWPLKNKKPHDNRAADYDDWKLNGDIIVYNPMLEQAFELSSMGIRVDKDSLMSQIKYKHEEFKLSSPYHQDVLNERLPYTIGGGIGQSRLCMFYLEKKHIGEVQASVWDKEYIEKLKAEGINLL